MEIIFDNSSYNWSTISLQNFLSDNTPSGWLDFFNQPDVKDNILTISNFLQYEASHSDVTIYPNINDVFKALYMVPIDSIRVIIIGQDPYHDGAATGLAFDVASGRKINPSLRNIYKELNNCGNSPKQTGRLLHWADQGVLLINTALTVRKGCPESHIEIWNQFSEKLLHYIIQYHKTNSIVWFLMGSKAHQYINIIPKSHHIIRTTHPSPLAAIRSTKKSVAFIGSGCFTEINNILTKYGTDPIIF